MDDQSLATIFRSESAEHYTPPRIVGAVIDCMGGIDLDPCADPGRQIPALRHYTKNDGGLLQPWSGRVYVNPPYGRQISLWINKLLQEYQAGNVLAGIMLLPARTDTKWWHLLRDCPVCLVSGRLRFGDAKYGAPFPSAIFYLGRDLTGFLRAFSPIGDIWVRARHERLLGGGK
jgi:hypothetical protein